MYNKFILFAVFVLIVGCTPKKKSNETTTYSNQYICMPIVTDRDWYNEDNKAPLFEGMGDLDFQVTTDNSLVKKYINQGLTLAYGFNHAEAARSFYYATRLDSTCAMAYWGYAYVLGPNYNAGMEKDNYERAYSAIQKALELSNQSITDKEKDLILALSNRYTKEPVDDRSALDAAYVLEMRKLFHKYPDDPDIGTMFAEAIMNTHPWDLYEKNGDMKEWTPEIISTLEKVMKNYPNHCGAHHFYIHAVEASLTPERGLASAKVFDDDLVPNAGHLVHMPSHIYIRTGYYHKGTLANLRAMNVDSTYVETCHAQGVYPLAYYPHNQHFMAATATLEGNSEWALYAANKVSENANILLMKEPGWTTIQHYYTIPFNVYVKFGKWNEILQMENKVPDLIYPDAIWHYARGMAYLGKDELPNAEQELAQLKEIAKKEELKEITIWDVNSTYDLVQIADKVLSAELLAKEGQLQESIKLLKEAIEIEDRLNYNEPPDWFFSVRHTLGAVQLKAGLYEDAIQTYSEDLHRLPKNGWALSGLVLAYEEANNMQLKEETEKQFASAWETADVELSGSVIR